MSAQLAINLGITNAAIKSSIKTFQLSKRFTKHMVKCSILNILANRIMVNEGDLKLSCLEKVPFFVFKRRKNNVKDPHLQRFLRWVDGIEDSIEKNFLKEIFILMKNVQKNDIVESYKFKLKYNPDTPHTNKPTLSNESVKEDVLAFLKLVKQLGDNDKLDKSTMVEIELKYNENTPFEYEPPGFKFTHQPYCTLIKDPFDTYLGAINTGYHQLSCMGQRRMITEEKQNEKATHNKENVLDKIQVSEDIKLEPREKSAKRKVVHISNVTVSFDNSIISLSSGSIEDLSAQTDCICGIYLPDAEKIYCFSCKNMFHSICCGYLEVPEYSIDICCAICDSNNTKSFFAHQTDAKLRLLLYYLNKDKLDTILPVLLTSGFDGHMLLRELEILHQDNSLNYPIFEQLTATVFKQPDYQLLDV